jgi:hypothetical protein
LLFQFIWDRHFIECADEQKAESLMVLLRDISFIDVHEIRDDGLKIWDGAIAALDCPIVAGDFKIYSKEELHER